MNWDTIELYYEIYCASEIRPSALTPAGRRDPVVSGSYAYKETKAGRRYARVEWRTGDGRVLRRTGFCDIDRYATLNVTVQDGRVSHSAGVSRSFMNEAAKGNSERPDWLGYLYVGKRPLFEAMRDGEVLGESHRLGRRVTRVLFRRVKFARAEQNLLYEIDCGCGLPLMVTSYSSEDAITYDTPAWSWEVTRLGEADGHHFARESIHKDYGPGGRGSADVETLRTATLRSIRFNKHLDAREFWPDLPRPAGAADRAAAAVACVLIAALVAAVVGAAVRLRKAA